MMLKDPFEQFTLWYQEALNTSMTEPTAMTLATATKDGKPSARTLLMKEYNERGFCFFTNLTSRKGKELSENPYATMCFYWDELGKQIRIEGKVERVTEKEADDYFARRQRQSQIGAWASKQSCLMENDDDLDERITTITKQFENQDVPRPPFWSGYRLMPETIEFWNRRDYRLHKRHCYYKTPTGWTLERLYP